MLRVVDDAKLSDRILVDSAGTISFHVGKPPDARMRRAGAKRGYEFRSRARQIHRRDLRRFDLIVPMDRSNLEDILLLDPSAKTGHIRLLSSFLGDGWDVDVPDPYYGGDAGFEYVIEMVEAACPAILAELRVRLGGGGTS